MIQIDCAVTDTKTLHIPDTHFRHNNDLKHISSDFKQIPGTNKFVFYYMYLDIIIIPTKPTNKYFYRS